MNTRKKDFEKMKKACFLDRDGVLIEDAHYLKNPEDVKIIHGAYEALKRLKAAGFLCIVTSNQSGIARGYFTEDNIKAVQKRISQDLAEQDLAIDAWYNCPHHPKGTVPEYAKECNCRKPAPGMILQAAKDYDIDVKSSFMIGDKFSDLKAASNAGVPVGILVRTGHGKEEIETHGTSGVIITDDIAAAVDYYFTSILKKLTCG